MNAQIINVILKDDKGNLYRIFKIAHGKDKYGENYFKVMIPDLIGKKINTLKAPKYVKPPDLKNFINSIREFNIEGFHEFTYHYESGVAHLKNNQGDRIHQIKGLPKLQDKKFLNFIRFVIHDLNSFRIYKRKTTDKDILITLPLNDLGRLFNLYLLDDINVRIDNDDVRVALIGDYKINVVGTKKYLIIQEFCYVLPQSREQDVSFSLFIFNDTTIKLDSEDKNTQITL